MQAPPASTPRDRILTNDELARVWRARRDDTYGKIVKLLILTGQRRGEITGLTGAMVGADEITLPSENTKNGRRHVVPLGTMAKAILGATARGRRALLSGAGRRRHRSTASRRARRISTERCGFSDWTVHDLRRTFASGLAAIGVQLPVIERLLNHVSGSFGGIVSRVSALRLHAGNAGRDCAVGSARERHHSIERSGRDMLALSSCRRELL